MKGLFLGATLALVIASGCAHIPENTRGAGICYRPDKTWYHERSDTACDQGGTHASAYAPASVPQNYPPPSSPAFASTVPERGPGQCMSGNSWYRPNLRGQCDGIQGGTLVPGSTNTCFLVSGARLPPVNGRCPQD